MIRRFAILALVAAMVTVMAAPAFANPGKPSFAPELYADGETWGTKGTTGLPAPNAHNLQSFDKLFVITNGADGQLPVGEAAPGNPNYNGGRWITQTVVWTDLGIDQHDGGVPLLTSYAEVMEHEALDHLRITPGSPGGPLAPPDYFQCPLLPVK